MAKVSKDREERAVKKRNTTWTRNQIAIQESYLTLAAKLQRAPTIAEVVKESGLSHVTVEKHIQAIVFEPTKTLERIFTPNVTKALLEAAEDKNIKAIELWYKIFENWREKVEVKHDVITVTIED